jgi:thymidylate synthase (FAD)
MVVAAARVSTTGEAALAFADPSRADECAGLINYLMAHRHGTPFEHSALTLFVHAPAMVWWEWVRHRIGHSFNLESGRYKRLDPVFWVPGRERKLMPAPGHKPARPAFEPADPDTHARVVTGLRDAYLYNWSYYRSLLGMGVANEVARAVLGFGVYYSGWVTVNPRSLMMFLSLRTHEPAARFVSYPQAEIEQAARVAEKALAAGWPLTYRAFVKNGRVAP